MIDAPGDTDDLTQIHVRSWRRMWLATSMHELKCPAGHRLRDPIVLDHGCIRCKYVDPNGNGARQDCGKLTYVMAGLRTVRGSQIVLCCEVTVADMRQMTDQHMSVDEIVAFLGIVL